MKHKVGDKVRVKSLDWYNSNKNEDGYVSLRGQSFTEDMTKFCGNLVTIREIAGRYYIIKEDDFGWYFTDEMFEDGIYLSELYCNKTQKIIWTESAPDITELVIGENYELVMDGGIYKVIKKRLHKEETMEEIYINKIGFNDDKAKLILPDGYEFKVEGDEVFVVKKKPKYPKTYEECCDIMYGSVANTYGNCVIKINDGYKGSLIQSFQRLIFYRDVYWKIAGDWKPDWVNANERKYCIVNTEGNIMKWVQKTTNKNLAFPTEEMRDAFYENFKDLVEQCKELL